MTMPCFGGRREHIEVLSWNVASINKNPFEFWLETKDAGYNKLMDKVEQIITNPGKKNISVSDVFSEKMFQKLYKKVEGIDKQWGKGAWIVQQSWNEYKKMKIFDFIMNDDIGEKRLVSMPDRVTANIETAKGTKHRPTAINNYIGKLKDLDSWYHLWFQFMFEEDFVDPKTQGVEKAFRKLVPISKDKYPALDKDEAENSLQLQVLALAIFDAAMVYLMTLTNPKKWLKVKKKMFKVVDKKKIPMIVNTLKKKYISTDVMFLQEVSEQVMTALKADPKLKKAFHFVSPKDFDAARNQNSIALLSKEHFDDEIQVQDVPSSVDDIVGRGDLLLIWCKSLKYDIRYQLASFHGDTGGLSTVKVLNALKKDLDARENSSEVVALWGMDANAYSQDKKNVLKVAEFHEAYTKHGMRTSWGTQKEELAGDKFPRTTLNARTFCQPQLNKAVARANYELNEKCENNPKDYILFRASGAMRQKGEGYLDNVGRGPLTIDEHDKTVWMPGEKFPSDHAIVYAEFEIKT